MCHYVWVPAVLWLGSVGSLSPKDCADQSLPGCFLNSIFGFARIVSRISRHRRWIGFIRATPPDDIALKTHVRENGHNATNMYLTRWRGTRLPYIVPGDRVFRTTRTLLARPVHVLKSESGPSARHSQLIKIISRSAVSLINPEVLVAKRNNVIISRPRNRINIDISRL